MSQPQVRLLAGASGVIDGAEHAVATHQQPVPERLGAADELPSSGVSAYPVRHQVDP
jgi:hypothetical protein